jgi:hypothetical protein
MKNVWKCDFCSHTDESVDRLKEHEDCCSFNPITKKCFTCMHFWDSGYVYSIPECKKDLSTLEGIDEGNCSGWCGISDPNLIETEFEDDKYAESILKNIPILVNKFKISTKHK